MHLIAASKLPTTISQPVIIALLIGIIIGIVIGLRLRS